MYKFARLEADWQAASPALAAALQRIFERRGETARAGASLATAVEAMKGKGPWASKLAFHEAHNPEGLHITLPENVETLLTEAGAAPDAIFFRPKRLIVLNNSNMEDPAMFDASLRWATRYVLACDVFADEDCVVPLELEFPHISIGLYGIRVPEGGAGRRK